MKDLDPYSRVSPDQYLSAFVPVCRKQLYITQDALSYWVIIPLHMRSSTLWNTSRTNGAA